VTTEAGIEPAPFTCPSLNQWGLAARLDLLH
jgi:hypothetical protein